MFDARPLNLPAAGLCLTLFMPAANAALIGGINHTHWAINRFSVDGRSAIDVIGPYQGGGGGCCYVAPPQWQPGMVVRVDWETGEAYPDGFPGFADRAKYEKWAEKIRDKKRLHSREVDVPNYTNQKQCGITVHFLPCDELQVTTSCLRYGSPNYPIKAPLHLPVPTSCPSPVQEAAE